MKTFSVCGVVLVFACFFLAKSYGQVKCEQNCIQTSCFAEYKNGVKQCYVPKFNLGGGKVGAVTDDATMNFMQLPVGLGGGANNLTGKDVWWYESKSCNVPCDVPAGANGLWFAGNCSHEKLTQGPAKKQFYCKGGS